MLFVNFPVCVNAAANNNVLLGSSAMSLTLQIVCINDERTRVHCQATCSCAMPFYLHVRANCLKS